MRSYEQDIEWAIARRAAREAAMKESEATMTYCEDYPCCGHTPSDPCGRQWYDEPYAFDLSRNPHALCEHEFGFCEVYD